MERNARRWLTCGEQLHADRSQKFSQWAEEGTTQIRECWRATTSPTSPRPKESRAGRSVQGVQTFQRSLCARGPVPSTLNPSKLRTLPSFRSQTVRVARNCVPRG